MLNFFKEVMTTGLGALFFTKDMLDDMVKQLVEEGKVSRKEAEKMVDDMVDKAKNQREELRDKIKSEIENSLDKTGLAKKNKLEKLEQRVNQLELHIKSLEKELEDSKNSGIDVVDDDA